MEACQFLLDLARRTVLSRYVPKGRLERRQGINMKTVAKNIAFLGKKVGNDLHVALCFLSHEYCFC